MGLWCFKGAPFHYARIPDVHSWFFLYEPSDKLHLAALNPPAQFQKFNRSNISSLVLIATFITAYVLRLSKYLAQNERDNERKSFERFGQFDVGYHNISFDEEQ